MRPERAAEKLVKMGAEVRSATLDKPVPCDHCDYTPVTVKDAIRHAFEHIEELVRDAQDDAEDRRAP